MPLYTYRCDGCKDVQEVLQSFKEMEKGIDPCPKCNLPYHRLIGDNINIGLTDSVMLKSAYKSREQYDKTTDDRGKLFEKMAKAAGVDTTGKWLDPSLARYLGDPEAWVGSVGEIQAKCRARGWQCKIVDGIVKITIPADITRPVAEQTPNLVKT